MYVGHALASYALADHWPEGNGAISHEGNPKWRQVLVEAIESTRVTHPVSRSVSPTPLFFLLTLLSNN